MRRILLLGTVLLLLGIAATASAQGSPEAPVSAAQTGGTSPWVLVLIGAAAGAVVGALTGLARRRRAERAGREERGDPG